jgi:hypothetical protein
MHLIEIKNNLTITPKEYVGPPSSLLANNVYTYPECKPECMSIITPDSIRAGSDYYVSRNRCLRTTIVKPETVLQSVIDEVTDPAGIFESCSSTTETRYPEITGQYILIQIVSMGIVSPSIPINSITVYNEADIISTDAIIAMSGQFVNNTDISPFEILNNTSNARTNFVLPASIWGFILIDLKVIKTITRIRIQHSTPEDTNLFTGLYIYLANDLSATDIIPTIPGPYQYNYKCIKTHRRTGPGMGRAGIDNDYTFDNTTYTSIIMLNHRYLYPDSNRFNTPDGKVLKGFIYTNYEGKSFIPKTYEVTAEQLRDAMNGTLSLTDRRNYFDNSINGVDTSDSKLAYNISRTICPLALTASGSTILNIYVARAYNASGQIMLPNGPPGYSETEYYNNPTLSGETPLLSVTTTSPPTTRGYFQFNIDGQRTVVGMVLVGYNNHTIDRLFYTNNSESIGFVNSYYEIRSPDNRFNIRHIWPGPA